MLVMQTPNRGFTLMASAARKRRVCTMYGPHDEKLLSDSIGCFHARLARL